MAALFREMEGNAETYRDYSVTSVFIGGGTPSVLEPRWIAELLERARTHFPFADAEITIEVNPGTADREKLKIYRGAGVNRLSIGLQSASNEELRRLGRIHTYEQFLETYRLAREAGFANINVDLMSALPGQTLDSYRQTLRKVLALTPPPEHISAYSLIVEEGTPFSELAAAGRLVLPDEDCERLMYQETKRILEEAGLHRYEISNYAREGLFCRHNCGYWRRTEYLGLGLGAASLVGNTRFHNTEDLQEYLGDPLDCRRDFQELTVQEQMEETLFLGLRMTEGVCAKLFRETYGSSLEEVYGEVIQKNIREGLLCWRGDREFLALTEQGLDVSNHVMAEFLFDEP